MAGGGDRRHGHRRRPPGARRPRPAGASMLVGPDGTAVGSVSGGCVEGAVYEEAKDVVETGEPTLERYGVSDDDAFAVGLTCGGILDVFVESISRESFPELGEIAESIDAHEPVAVVTVVKGPDDRLGRRLVLWPDRDVGHARPAAAGRRGRRRRPRDARRRPHRRTMHVGHDGERRGDDLTLFVNSFAPAGPHGRVRRDRLRRRRRPGGRVPRLPGHRLRRPAGVRDAEAVPRRRRGDRRVAAPLPAGRGRRGPHRRAHGAVRAHPRPEVRRPAAGGRPAHPGRLRRRDGLAAHARGAGGAAAPRRGCRRRRSAGCPRRSGSTSAPGRRRRPRSRSPRRSSPAAGAARASGWPAPTARSTRPPSAERLELPRIVRPGAS